MFVFFFIEAWPETVDEDKDSGTEKENADQVNENGKVDLQIAHLQKAFHYLKAYILQSYSLVLTQMNTIYG